MLDRREFGWIALLAALVVAVPSSANAQTDAEAWAGRAHIAMQRMLGSIEGANVARNIQQFTHPSGNNAVLRDFSVSEYAGGVLEVRIVVEWRGGYLGGDYITTVNWRCTQTQHLAVTVEGDSAAIAIDAAHRMQLNAYFRGTLYPWLLGEAH